MSPPVSVINHLHKIFAKFFWANATGAKNKHWVSWENICYPREEGGIGFRYLHTVAKALSAKLW